MLAFVSLFLTFVTATTPACRLHVSSLYGRDLSHVFYQQETYSHDPGILARLEGFQQSLTSLGSGVENAGDGARRWIKETTRFLNGPEKHELRHAIRAWLRDLLREAGHGRGPARETAQTGIGAMEKLLVEKGDPYFADVFCFDSTHPR